MPASTGPSGPRWGCSARPSRTSGAGSTAARTRRPTECGDDVAQQDRDLAGVLEHGAAGARHLRQSAFDPGRGPGAPRHGRESASGAGAEPVPANGPMLLMPAVFSLGNLLRYKGSPTSAPTKCRRGTRRIRPPRAAHRRGKHLRLRSRWQGIAAPPAHHRLIASDTATSSARRVTSFNRDSSRRRSPESEPWSGSPGGSGGRPRSGARIRVPGQTAWGRSSGPRSSAASGGPTPGPWPGRARRTREPVPGFHASGVAPGLGARPGPGWERNRGAERRREGPTSPRAPPALEEPRTMRGAPSPHDARNQLAVSRPAGEGRGRPRPPPAPMRAPVKYAPRMTRSCTEGEGWRAGRPRRAGPGARGPPRSRCARCGRGPRRTSPAAWLRGAVRPRLSRVAMSARMRRFPCGEKSTRTSEERSPARRQVPGVGLEPTRPNGQRFLRPSRLPVPPSRQDGAV